MTARTLRNLAFAVLLALGTVAPVARAYAAEGSAERLGAFLDRLEVERHWPAGVHVDWRTGDPDGRPELKPGRHTHCSAFVAAAAERLGVYILRPPEHGQVLLANAQYEWLAGDGAAAGWQSIADPVAAQAAANRGMLVVASYRSHRDDTPGHIAIVRPGKKSAEAIVAEGPDVIQAGNENYTRVPLARGFAGHPAAWGRHEVVFYAHTIPAAALASP